jgi:hypothetical protein
MNKVIKEMKEKHIPFSQNFGNIGEVEYCNGCKTDQGLLIVTYPCDVVKVIDSMTTTTQCDHLFTISDVLPADFCPKCGTEL